PPRASPPLEARDAVHSFETADDTWAARAIARGTQFRTTARSLWRGRVHSDARHREPVSRSIALPSRPIAWFFGPDTTVLGGLRLLHQERCPSSSNDRSAAQQLSPASGLEPRPINTPSLLT